MVVFAPAHWLTQAVTHATNGQVLLQQARGTVWTGSAQLVLTGGAASQDRAALPGHVDWKLRPTWTGLRVQLNAACCTPAPLQAQVFARWSGMRVAVADGQSHWPAALLTGLGTPWNTLQPQGQLALQTQGLEATWAAGRMVLAGQAQLDARAMSSRLSTLRPMGSYRLALQGGDDGMVRAQEQTRQRADEMLVLQAAMGQWGTDLDALMPIANTTPLDWDGQVLRMTRRSSAVPDEGALVVAWTRRNNNRGTGQWLRWQSPPVRTRSDWQQAWQQAAQWASSPGDNERRFEVTLLPLDSWQIFYYRGGAWSNPLSSAGTPQGDASAAIPDGVRLQITLPSGQALAGQLTRDWVKPTLGGGRT